MKNVLIGLLIINNANSYANLQSAFGNKNEKIITTKVLTIKKMGLMDLRGAAMFSVGYLSTNGGEKLLNLPNAEIVNETVLSCYEGIIEITEAKEESSAYSCLIRIEYLQN